MYMYTLITDRGVLRLHAGNEFLSHHRHQRRMLQRTISKRWRNIALHNTGNTIMQDIDHTSYNMYSTMLKQCDSNAMSLQPMYRLPATV